MPYSITSSARADSLLRPWVATRLTTLGSCPDTWHAFDYPLVPPTPTVVQNGQTTHCVLKEEPVGTIIHVATQKPFTYADDCVGRNPHMAHSANSTHATEEAVRELLKTVFQLN